MKIKSLLTGKFFDLSPDSEFAVTIENPMFADDRIPVAVSTGIEFPLTATNKEAFGFVETMMLSPKNQKIPVVVLLGGIEIFTGQLEFDEYADKVLKYTFVAVETNEVIAGNIYDIECEDYSDVQFATFVKNARKGLYSDVGLPMIVRQPNSAKVEYVTTDAEDCSIIDKYANYLYTDQPYVVPAVRIGYLLKKIIPSLKVPTEIAGYIDFRQDISHWLTLDAGIRIDHHSHIGTEWIPQAGLSFHLPGSIELKASAGKGFRYPTIREMYMFPPKNPDLRPESMWNYELAFAQRLLDGRLSYSINVFYIDGKNLIVAVPRAGATPLNMNTGKIDNTGVEAEAAYRIHPHWSVETNYSYLHMDNPVLGAPEHKFYAGAMFSKNRWTVSTGLQYVANLYTDVDHVQTEDFVLWNINGSFKVTEWFDIWARGENLLAQRYEINAGYPMPKATIMAGINVKF